jgi:hypothetical protein
MSHLELAHIDIEKIANTRPIQTSYIVNRLMWLAVGIGILALLCGLVFDDPAHVWAAYYTNLLFWMGLAAGGCIIPAIFQIVRALWSPPVRRIAEANCAFLPYAYILFLASYFGKDYLFSWAKKPMPGREWWMQPDFVYLRFGVLLFVLFFLMNRYVRMSLRGDIGLAQEISKDKTRWQGWPYTFLTAGWKGSAKEISTIQPKLSWNGPLLVLAYVVIYSLFAFEMVMGMNSIWYSNMFGGFMFVGNIYIAWAVLTFTVIALKNANKDYASIVTHQQLWDLGKLTLGFGVLWAYLFFSQFLPQWYGNLPEETQWLILRTREYPWKGLGWFTFAASFILPFVLLLSRDIKKAPPVMATVCLIIFVGIWCEKYMLVMPEVIPDHIPFSFVEVGIFFGFLGAYVLSITSFLSKYPFVPISHPLTNGSTEW